MSLIYEKCDVMKDESEDFVDNVSFISKSRNLFFIRKKKRKEKERKNKRYSAEFAHIDSKMNKMKLYFFTFYRFPARLLNFMLHSIYFFFTYTCSDLDRNKMLCGIISRYDVISFGIKKIF